jgi:hypothetical protein
MRRIPLPFTSHRTRAFLGLMLLVNASCSDSPRDLHVTSTPSGQPAETSFAAQAEAVREGRSDLIRLDHNPVADDDLKHLVGLEDKLRRINLSQTTISDQGLAQIAEMKQLEQLRLASPQITDGGVAVLQGLPQLKHLHLIDVPLTDAGLVPLHSLKSLQSMYLDGTRGSEQAMTELVKALPGVHMHFDGGHLREDSGADHKH